MLKPTTKYKPEIPNSKSVLRMSPEKLVFEVGSTPLNIVTLLNHVKCNLHEINLQTGIDKKDLINAIELQDELDYHDFETLCTFLQSKLPKNQYLRDIVPELGYSPYNLAVLQSDLNLIQSKFSQLLGWSTPKLRQHIPSSTNSAQFSQMSIGNWVYVCETYIKVLKKADNKFNLSRDYKAPWHGSVKALALPTIPKQLEFDESLIC